MRVYLQTIGCRLNFSEIDALARQFSDLGHTIVHQPQEADLVIVNTCGVTAKAASDSRQRIRQVARAGADHIVVTGCWSTLSSDKAARLPGVRQVVDNQDKDRLLPLVQDDAPFLFDIEPIQRHPIPGMRLRTRAFIKVQDGCDNHCTFCITTLARGQGRSRTAAEVIAEIQALIDRDVHEFVLTGVHLGSWGRDLDPSQSLKDLIRAILDSTDLERLRLSSLEPWDLDTDFFDLWQDERLCPHLHLPLQSGSQPILHAMARKVTPQSFAELLQTARAAIPGVSISTDILVGFPGETEAFFQQSLEFVQQMQFSDGHIFTFSPRPGTAAARMSGQVSPRVMKERNRRMRSVLQALQRKYLQGFIHQEVQTLWESSPALDSNGWILSGLTPHNIRVKAHSPEQLWNQFSTVQVVGVSQGFLQGEIC